MNRRTASGIGWLIWSLMFVLTHPVHAAENVWSVEMLNSRKAEWDQLISATIRVEGRISIPVRGQFKLSKCELPFVVAEASAKDLPKRGSVQLSGRLKKEDGKLVFEVDRVEPIPSDVEQFDSRSAKFRNPKPEEWFALGDWATERSRFYNDAELAKKAASAYERGVAVAWLALAADDAMGRFELAQKITRYALPKEKRMELMHEGYRVRWSSILKSSPDNRATLKQLIDEMSLDLPGSNEPQLKIPEGLVARYEKEPLVAYRDSNDKIRRQFHRLFCASVILHTILLDAEQDGRNGDAIAERIENQIPEATAEALKYRNLKLAWRVERSATATRNEIQQLADDLRAHGQAETAQHAVRDWLKQREPRQREDGVQGLFFLAEDYLSLLNDEPRAVAILIEAFRKDPMFKDVSVKLNKLGYHNVRGTWEKGPAPNGSNPMLAQDTPRGEPEVGMTATELVRISGGRPGSITRVPTKTSVAEIWTYGELGTSRMVIRLERGALETDFKIVHVLRPK